MYAAIPEESKLMSTCPKGLWPISTSAAVSEQRVTIVETLRESGESSAAQTMKAAETVKVSVESSAAQMILTAETVSLPVESSAAKRGTLAFPP